MTKGWKTSEFWIALLSMILTGGVGFDTALVGDTASWVSGIIGTAYVLGRSWIKAVQEKQNEK